MDYCKRNKVGAEYILTQLILREMPQNDLENFRDVPGMILHEKQKENVKLKGQKTDASKLPQRCAEYLLWTNHTGNR